MYLINFVVGMMKVLVESIILRPRRHTIRDLNEDVSIMVRTIRKTTLVMLIVGDNFSF